MSAPVLCPTARSQVHIPLNLHSSKSRQAVKWPSSLKAYTPLQLTSKQIYAKKPFGTSESLRKAGHFLAPRSANPFNISFFCQPTSISRTKSLLAGVPFLWLGPAKPVQSMLKLLAHAATSSSTLSFSVGRNKAFPVSISCTMSKTTHPRANPKAQANP